MAGINYRLCLKVSYQKQGEDAETTEFVKVVVFRSLQKEYSLTSWTEEECSKDGDPELREVLTALLSLDTGKKGGFMQYETSRSPLKIFVLTLYLALSASAASAVAQQPSQTKSLPSLLTTSSG